MTADEQRAQDTPDLDRLTELEQAATPGAVQRENIPADIPTADLIARAQHEVSQDRRIAGLMVQAKNRETLLLRAQVTEDLIAAARERDQLRATVERVRAAVATFCHGEQAYAEHMHYCTPILHALDSEEATDG